MVNRLRGASAAGSHRARGLQPGSVRVAFKTRARCRRVQGPIGGFAPQLPRPHRIGSRLAAEAPMCPAARTSNASGPGRDAGFIQWLQLSAAASCLAARPSPKARRRFPARAAVRASARSWRIPSSVTSSSGRTPRFEHRSHARRARSVSRMNCSRGLTGRATVESFRGAAIGGGRRVSVESARLGSAGGGRVTTGGFPRWKTAHDARSAAAAIATATTRAARRSALRPGSPASRGALTCGFAKAPVGCVARSSPDIERVRGPGDRQEEWFRRNGFKSDAFPASMAPTAIAARVPCARCAGARPGAMTWLSGHPCRVYSGA